MTWVYIPDTPSALPVVVSNVDQDVAHAAPLDIIVRVLDSRRAKQGIVTVGEKVVAQVLHGWGADKGAIKNVLARVPIVGYNIQPSGRELHEVYSSLATDLRI